MRFAILGDSPQATYMARALVETGRHEFVAYCPSLVGAIERFWPEHRAKRVSDLEEVLADPSIEVIVEAGGSIDRLRRALQSERHVLCANPESLSLESAYEAAMIQTDTGGVLMPLLAQSLHPVYARLAALLQDDKGPLGPLQLVRSEYRYLTFMGAFGPKSEAIMTFPGWDVLRLLRGEIAEVFAFAESEHPACADSVVLGARFERGGLVQMTCIPTNAPAVRWTIIGKEAEAELVYSEHVPMSLTVQKNRQIIQEETWGPWRPEPVLVEAFEAAVASFNAHGRVQPGAVNPSWNDAVRCLELDDAARRSIAKRRSSTLEYQDVSEEVGFKGTMTLVGCGLLWVIVLLVVLSRWIPWLGWGVIPVLIAFLVMQGLRWVLPHKK